MFLPFKDFLVLIKNHLQSFDINHTEKLKIVSEYNLDVAQATTLGKIFIFNKPLDVFEGFKLFSTAAQAMAQGLSELMEQYHIVQVLEGSLDYSVETSIDGLTSYTITIKILL